MKRAPQARSVKAAKLPPHRIDQEQNAKYHEALFHNEEALSFRLATGMEFHAATGHTESRSSGGPDCTVYTSKRK